MTGYNPDFVASILAADKLPPEAVFNDIADVLSEKSVIVTDPVALSAKSEPFDFENPQMDPIELSQKLVKAMVDNHGLGLSAIQIGIPLRVFAIMSRPQNVVLFNPVIVNASEETQTEVEGCLSFKCLLVAVTRPFEIRTRFKLPNQEVRTEKWGGLTARVVQHEMQHLNGEFFWKGCSRYHLDQAIKRAGKFGIDYSGSGLHKFR